MNKEADLIKTKVISVLSSILFILIFIENSIYSSSFNYLMFRGVNDVAFQVSLRNIHKNIENGRWNYLWSLNDYGYGWIYWATEAFITYPFYLWKSSSIATFLLIFIPRLTALIFTLLSAFYMYRILKVYELKELDARIGSLIFALMPVTGFFSLEFGTTNTIMFFCIISYYYVIKENVITGKNIYVSFLFAAIAGGIKLTGLFIAPILILQIYLRSDKGSILNFLFFIAKPAIFFVILLTVATNPTIIVFFINLEAVKSYIDTLLYFSATPRTNYGYSSFYDRLYYGLFETNASFLVQIFLLLGLAILAKKNLRYRPDVIIILIYLSIAYLVICYKILIIPSISSYLSSISFLLIIGLVGIAEIPSIGTALLCVLLIVQSYDIFSRSYSQYMHVSSGVSHFHYYVKSLSNKEELVSANNIENCFMNEMLVFDKKNIYLDHTVSTYINTLSYPNSCITYIFNNLTPQLGVCSAPDILILDSNSLSFQNEEVFTKKVSEVDLKVKETYLLDRKIRLHLLDSRKFGDKNFKSICKLDRVFVFISD